MALARRYLSKAHPHIATNRSFSYVLREKFLQLAGAAEGGLKPALQSVAT
jgi:hypothetical protein